MSLPLLMAAPPVNDDAEQVTLGFSDAVKLDILGPMVVNNDGTLSRIANWEKMTEEKERTMRVVAARNRCASCAGLPASHICEHLSNC
ncbi:hypothetical protein BDR04DRAFT_1011792 [Suillus decipiens]|nr:hypothetical protein BDR04DRAFT_1011792 [Suillus decipiens]